MRVGVNRETTAQVLATHSFSDFKTMGNDKGRIFAFYNRRRVKRFALDERRLDSKTAAWVATRWKSTRELTSESAEFYLAVSAVDAMQFTENTALTLVSLWGALEALFGGDRNELRFRISSYIASYLVSYGPGREIKQKAIAKLYDKQSAAVHGVPNHSDADVMATFELAQEVVCKIIDEGQLPTRESLERALCG